MTFALSDLRDLQGRSHLAARVELEKQLNRYQDFSGISVVLVFDGAGNRVQSEREGAGVQVIYSNQGRTADDVIERLVAKYAPTYELTVATDDYAEQETVRAHGAHTIGSEIFRDLLGASERSFEERLRRHRKR